MKAEGGRRTLSMLLLLHAFPGKGCLVLILIGKRRGAQPLSLALIPGP